MKRLLIIDREDLSYSSRHKDIKDIQFFDFRHEHMEEIRRFDIVLFQDLNGSMKVIKSRYVIENQNEIF